MRHALSVDPSSSSDRCFINDQCLFLFLRLWTSNRSLRVDLLEVPKGFIARKKLFLRKLEEAKLKREVDEDIIPLLDVMNKIPFIYTTSSCSGRIMLIDISYSQRKEDSIRLVRWHRTIDFQEFWNIVKEYTPRGVLWLKQEAFIVAFAVPSIEWASYLIRLARLFGFKESGIRSINLATNHIFMDISSTEKLHTPISSHENGLLITEQYGRYLVEKANSLLIRTKNRLKLLEKIMHKLANLILERNITNPDELGFKIFNEFLSRRY